MYCIVCPRNEGTTSFIPRIVEDIRSQQYCSKGSPHPQRDRGPPMELTSLNWFWPRSILVSLSSRDMDLGSEFKLFSLIADHSRFRTHGQSALGKEL